MKAGWKTYTFSAIGRIFNGNSISEREKKAHFEGMVEGLPYIGTKDVGFDHQINYQSGVKIPDGKKDGFKLAPANTIFVCAEGGSAGRKIAHTDKAVYFGNKLFAICPTSSNSSRFIFYYCLSNAFAEQFKGAMAGLIGGVSLNKFRDINITLPPLPEQQRIVGILDEALDSIATAKANAEKNLQNARALFESHLQTVFTQRGPGWVEKRLCEICEFSQGIQVDVKLQSENKTTSNQVRFLRIVDFTQGNEPVRYIDNPGEKFLVCRSDVSLVRYGASTGFVCNGLEGAIANNLFRVIPKGKYISNAFLYWFLKSSLFQEKIRESMNGAAMPAISFGMINDISIPFPSLPEQQQIVTKLNSIVNETQRLESIYQQKLAALEELKKSLLNQAFTGEL